MQFKIATNVEKTMTFFQKYMSFPFHINFNDLNPSSLPFITSDTTQAGQTVEFPK